MKNKKTCFNCGQLVAKDVVALHKKLFSDNVDRFFCLPCLADYMECSEEDLKRLIKELKERGCVYFK
jgi:biotin operon repressor